jgi:hypothetical protein
MNVAEHRRATATSGALRKRIAEVNQTPALNKEACEVIPFPAARQAFVKDWLKAVDADETTTAYRELSSVVRSHRRYLTKIGVAPERIDVDCASLSAAFGIDGKAERGLPQHAARPTGFPGRPRGNTEPRLAAWHFDRQRGAMDK